MNAIDKSIDILIVDDIDIVRLGLKLALTNSPIYRVVGECSDGQSAVAMADRFHPDVVLMDIGMPKMDGIEAAAQIKKQAPKSRVIMFTSHDDDTEILAAFGAGADGYCIKDLSSSDLRMAIGRVFEGERWIDPRLVKQLAALTGKNQRQAQEQRNKFTADQAPAPNSGKFLEPSASIAVAEASQSEQLRTSISSSTTPAILKAEGVFAGRYRIEKVIGSGGMGMVYKAMHVFLERNVAIKVLHPESALDLKTIAQFKRESQAASALKHPNIVTVYDFAVTDLGEPFLVMDYVDGISLDKLFERTNFHEKKRYLDIFMQVCDGLAVTHAHGLVHCDLKPSNIMIEIDASGSDCVRIVDFGLAKAIPKAPTVQSKLTDSFEITGSPLYMSPEQCSSSCLDARSDIYSLGCIMYEAFTGKPVFNGKSAYKVFSQHLSEQPLPFAAILPAEQNLSALETIVFKTLKKRPEERYQSILELQQDLIKASPTLPTAS